MKLSLKWLGDFIDIKDLSVEDIIKKATDAGFEIEGVEYLGEGTDLVVGKVIECHPHPDSDHLKVTKVDIKDEILDIVCGAPNCREGLKVIVAKVGAKLPGGTINASVIRGEASNGMLCSLLELGVKKELLPENSPSLDGIEELGDEFAIGEEDVLEKLGYKDVILDVSIYANRPDCLSMFAMAKEFAAILDRPCHLPDFKGASDIGETTDFKLNFTQFSSQPIKIISVRDTFGRPVRFKVFDSYLMALAGNVEVEYTTMPEKMDIDDEFSSSLPERVYAYGIAREFCFLQSLFDDADVWDDRFKNTLEVLLQRKSELRMPGRRWI